MGVYEELRVRRVINACSTATHLGGSIPDPRVMEAMEEAAGRYVIMTELQDRAGEIIARATGAEAAMVTAGATSSLQLGAAACLLRDSGLEEHSVKPYERLQPIDGPWKAIIQRVRPRSKEGDPHTDEPQKPLRVRLPDGGRKGHPRRLIERLHGGRACGRYL